MNDKRRVQVEWLGDYRTRIDVRGVHQMQGDETPEYGGDDSGPMPTELLLAAVGTCMCLAVAHVARKRRIQITQITVDAGAEKDMQEFRFRDIYLTIRADLPQDRLDSLVEQARRYCFVSNTLIAGCQIHCTNEAIVAPATPAVEE